MKLDVIAGNLALRDLTPELHIAPATEVAVGFASDSARDILVKAPAGGVLVTNLGHLKVIAAAVQARIAAVILASSSVPLGHERVSTDSMLEPSTS